MGEGGRYGRSVLPASSLPRHRPSTARRGSEGAQLCYQSRGAARLKEKGPGAAELGSHRPRHEPDQIHDSSQFDLGRSEQSFTVNAGYDESVPRGESVLRERFERDRVLLDCHPRRGVVSNEIAEHTRHAHGATLASTYSPACRQPPKCPLTDPRTNRCDAGQADPADFRVVWARPYEDGRFYADLPTACLVSSPLAGARWR